MPERFDRLVAHITREYEAKGYSAERAQSIAYATANKVKHEQASDEDTDTDESAEQESADE